MKKLLSSAFLLCAVFTIHAQETIPVSGGDATGSGGSSSYSVGQLVYTTNTGSGKGGFLTNGTILGKGGDGGNMYSGNAFQYPPKSGNDGKVIIQY